MDREQIKADFEFLKEDERVLGVLVFGSRVRGRELVIGRRTVLAA